MFTETPNIGDYLYRVEDGNVTKSKIIDIDDKYYYKDDGIKVNKKTMLPEKSEKDKIKLDKIKFVIQNLSYDDLSYSQIHDLDMRIRRILERSE